MTVRVMEFDKSEEEVSRRLLTALIIEWEKLPRGNRDELMRNAVWAFDPATKRIGRYEEIAIFLRKRAPEAGIGPSPSS